MENPLEEDLALLIREREALRDAIKKFLSAEGHDLCHENRRELAAAAGLKSTWPSLVSEQEFAERCIKYRLELYGHDGPGSETEVWEKKFEKLAFLMRYFLKNREKLTIESVDAEDAAFSELCKELGVDPNTA